MVKVKGARVRAKFRVRARVRVRVSVRVRVIGWGGEGVKNWSSIKGDGVVEGICCALDEE
jgi:hypothetical protein